MKELERPGISEFENKENALNRKAVLILSQGPDMSIEPSIRPNMVSYEFMPTDYPEQLMGVSLGDINFVFKKFPELMDYKSLSSGGGGLGKVEELQKSKELIKRKVEGIRQFLQKAGYSEIERIENGRGPYWIQKEGEKEIGGAKAEPEMPIPADLFKEFVESLKGDLQKLEGK